MEDRNQENRKDAQKETGKKDNTVSTTLLIVMIALASAVAATLAWFSIADTGKLSNMKFNITTGKSLRFDLEAHSSFEDYRENLSFEEICEQALKEKGIDPEKASLLPVTTEDGVHFTHEQGDEVDASSGEYLEFVLHFMATTDMKVHLTSEDSDKQEDGTLITSENADVPQAMRISFTEDKAGMKIYDPGLGNKTEIIGNLSYFGLLPKAEMLYNDTNMLFEVPENTDVPVTVRVWVEGTDEACTNDIKESDYSIRLRFEGMYEDEYQKK